MFCGAWQESSQNQIELKDISKESFELVLSFIYKNELPITTPQDAIDYYRIGISRYLNPNNQN